jgi:Tfp pilus assembly protein PilF
MNARTAQFIRRMQWTPRSSNGVAHLVTLVTAERQRLIQEGDGESLLLLMQSVVSWADGAAPRVQIRVLLEVAEVLGTEFGHTHGPEEMYQRALALAPGDFSITDRARALFEKMNRLPCADAVFLSQACVLDAFSGAQVGLRAKAWRRLGTLRADAGDMEGAVSAFDKALDIQPEVETLLALASALERRAARGDASDAAELYAVVADQVPEDQAHGYRKKVLVLEAKHEAELKAEAQKSAPPPALPVVQRSLAPETYRVSPSLSQRIDDRITERLDQPQPLPIGDGAFSLPRTVSALPPPPAPRLTLLPPPSEGHVPIALGALRSSPPPTGMRARDSAFPRDREVGWARGLIWGVVAGLAVAALGLSPVSTWAALHGPPVVRKAMGVMFGRPTASAVQAPQPAKMASTGTAANAQSEPADRAEAAKPRSDAGEDDPAVAANAAPAPSELSLTVGRLTGKVTRIRGGKLTRKAVTRALSKSDLRVSSCQRALHDESSDLVAVTWLVAPSGRVKWVRAQSPREAQGSAYGCAREILEKLRFPAPRGGAARIEGVVTLAQRTSRRMR